MRERSYITNADRQRAYRQRKRAACAAPIVTLPTPYYQDRYVTLYHGNSYALLPLFEPASVDLVLTDPPYAATTHAGARTSTTGGPDALVNFASFNDSDIGHMFARLAPLARAWLISFLDWRHMLTLEQQPPGGLRFVRFGIWDKMDTGAPQFSGDRPATGWEAIVFLHRPCGKMQWHGQKDAVYHARVEHGPHPTQKPMRLISQLILHGSKAGELILDPFAGSGTTLAAAKKLGRRAIGIELDERYCEIAAQRLCQDVMDLEVAA